ncbi:MAG: winged helix-turn-helix transcriptional regulator [Prevotellaceae bacterium]|jgi:predicted HTH transcriptional regulator|nr:winged helix-turn-helix transcriptional regulator [Prevotellaceae bacterium]
MKIEFGDIPNGFLVTYNYTHQKTTTTVEEDLENADKKNLEKSSAESVVENVVEKTGNVVENDLENDSVKRLENLESKVEALKKKSRKKIILPLHQQRILDAIRKNNQITQRELSQKIGINEKNIRVNISKLKADGLLERIGPAKGGYWKINSQYLK